MKKIDIVFSLILCIASFLLVFDLFFNPGQPATFDGTTHITNIAQFYKGLKDGDFPVRWADGFANYGMPIPIIAQQVTSYTGALITFLTHNVVLSYNLTYFIGALLSTVFFYIFLRFYFSPEASFAGAFLLNFASYRIINIYIRADLPEFFSSVFFPLLFIGTYLLIVKRNSKGLFLLIISSMFLVLTHAFLFVVAMFLLTPYLIYLLINTKKRLKLFLLFIASLILGILLTGYYILPLLFEIKYFYYGRGYYPLVPNQYLSLINYFNPYWYYYYKTDVFVRGNFIKFGIIESIIIVISIGLALYQYIKKKKVDHILLLNIITAILLIFFTTSLSNIFYTKISALGGIQFPWRMLSGLMFISGILIAYITDKTGKYKKMFVIAFLIIFAFFQFPQLYGKNYTLYPQSTYFFTIKNLHGTILNTIWTGKTEGYPVEKDKIAIISGKGVISNEIVKNSSRTYTLTATTPVRIADYTFYFPGWHVFANGTEIPIQFQDPNYRGVITYNLDKGSYSVKDIFKDTKIRVIGDYITIILGFVVIILFLIELKYKYLQKMLR